MDIQWVVYRLLGVLLADGEHPESKTPSPYSAVRYIFPSQSILAGNWTVTIHSEKLSERDAVTNECVEEESDFCPARGYSNETVLERWPGYKQIHGQGLYKLHVEPVTWDTANDTCAQEGAHLMIIDSDLEVEVVKTLYGREKNRLLTIGLHMGVHDRHGEGHFRNVFGQSVDDSRWRPGQPDGGVEQNCGFTYADGRYCDGDCEWKMGFLCEAPESN